MIINIGSGFYLEKDNICIIFDKNFLENSENRKLVERFKLENKIVETCDKDKIKTYLYYNKDGEDWIYTTSFISKTLYDRFNEDWRE